MTPPSDNELDEFNGRHEYLHNREKYDIHNTIFHPMFRNISGAMDIDQLFERNGCIAMWEMKPIFNGSIYMRWGQYKAYSTASRLSDRQKVYFLGYNNEGRNQDDIEYIANVRNINPAFYEGNTGKKWAVIPLSQVYKTNFQRLLNYPREVWNRFEKSIYQNSNGEWTSFEERMLKVA